MKNNLSEYRKKARLTLEQLGDAVGSSKSHIWAIEKGKSPNIGIYLGYAIAAAVGARIDEVFPDTNEYEKETITITSIKK